MLTGSKVKHTRGRELPKRETQIRITAAVASAAVLTVTFDQPVILRGTPAWTTDLPGVTPVEGSAVMTSLNTMELTFSASIATATAINIPVIDPAIRSVTGGFVADTTFPL
jgi:hypothetical protein